jgi:membrane fusion protein, multidrug efflux system
MPANPTADKMRLSRLAIGIAALSILVGVGVGVGFVRATAHAKDASPSPPAPTAAVDTSVPQMRMLVRRLDAIGDVTPSKTVGLSFARAGQVTQMDVVPGRRVAKGAILAVLSADPASVQAYAQAVTTTDLAQREWQRQQELFKLQLATQSQVDAAEKAFKDAEGNVKALRAIGGGAGGASLTAPFEGVVVSTAIAQGDRVAAGAPILQLGRIDHLKVQLGIEPGQSGLVRPGAHVRLVPVLAPDSEAVAVDSAVSSVEATVDAKTQQLTAVAILSGSSDARFVPGMKVRAAIDIERVSALSVPRDSVLTDENGDYLFQVDAGKARRIDVRRGIEADGYVAVDGIKIPSAPVITTGNAVLEDGMAVRVDDKTTSSKGAAA